MLVSRSIRSASCTYCRQSVLRIFSGNASLLSNSAGPTRRTLGQRQTRRSLSTADSQEHQDATVEEQTVPKHASTEPSHDAALASPLEITEATSSLPWYLQVQSQEKAAHPLSERQKLPDLPDSPPPILQPLLQHISVDLGLDELALLDLRKLDPPPALGANLLMIIGTARSEKHLHVSADRLCRWLRSEYKLSPDADGLLGRNELKLKLRRKARRAKLIGKVAEEDADDGVRTGWVCINVGTVESLRPQTQDITPGGDFIGFGRRSEGVKIVVQMLTEEKREEIDLEHLWGGIIRRNTSPGLVAVEEDYEMTSTTEAEGSRHDYSPDTPLTTYSAMRIQSRAFHTSTRVFGSPTSQLLSGSRPQAPTTGSGRAMPAITEVSRPQ